MSKKQRRLVKIIMAVALATVGTLVDDDLREVIFEFVFSLLNM